MLTLDGYVTCMDRERAILRGGDVCNVRTVCMYTIINLSLTKRKKERKIVVQDDIKR